MVPRRRAELRRARLPAGPAGRHGNPPRHRVTGRGRDRLGRASRAGRPLRRRAAAAGRRTRRPRGRLHAERPETVVALLATASIGAIWSSCAPEFGTPTVVDRFRQIEPQVLIAAEGYRYGGREFDRRERVREIEAAIPSLEHVVMVPSDWARLLAEPAELTFERVPFDHPLWVLYSSGTTGLPKAIVQGHGGILLEHLKKANSLGPGAGRPLLLVYDHRVDDVELSRRRPARRVGDRALRRAARPAAPVVAGRGGRSHLLRRQRGLHRRLPEGRRRTTHAAAAAQHRVHGIAARGRGLRVGLPPLSRRLALLHERRHGPLHGLRGRVPAPARLRRRAPGPLPGRGGGGVGRAGPPPRGGGGSS